MKRIKRETTLPKLRGDAGRPKGTEPSAGGTAEHSTDASLVCGPCDGQRGRDVENRKGCGLKATNPNFFVPVVDTNNKPLMPTTCSRVRRWIKSGKGTGFWKRGIYCVRLNTEPSSRVSQDICIGVDPGSKREGMTIKSMLHTYLNVHIDATNHVKDAMETRRNLRKFRRQRTTPCRKPRFKRSRGKNFIPPRTKSRWQLKLRIINWMRKIYPITHCVVEDVKAKTIKNGKHWNHSFSPIQSGKNWFYAELRKVIMLELKYGYDTKIMRDTAKLVKNPNKLAETFNAHCVDSWVLANSLVCGHDIPDNKNLIIVKPLNFHRRRLHVMNPAKYGIRKRCGGTISIGLKRGSIVVHVKYKLCYVSGTYNNRISLNSLNMNEHIDGGRLCRNAKLKDIKFLSYNSFLISHKNNITT